MTARPLAAAMALAFTTACAPLYRRPPHGVEQIALHAADGWPLVLHHFPPTGRRLERLPVVLCHGLITNAYYMDLDPAHSLARYLAGRGFDVWVLDLRGHGDSGKPARGTGRSYAWSFDDYAERDVPAAVATVRRLTGAPGIGWVGHSMGGMVLYAHLSRHPGEPGISRAAVLGSPATFRFADATLRTLAIRLSLLFGRRVPFATMSSLFVGLAGRRATVFDHFLYAPANLAPETWRAFLARGADDESGVVARQFTTWLERREWTDSSGAFSYERHLGRIRVPLLVIAGRVDNLAPVESVRHGYDAVGSAERSWIVLGKESGALFDYGHTDMVLGERAAVEVFPYIESWLRHGDDGRTRHRQRPRRCRRGDSHRLPQDPTAESDEQQAREALQNHRRDELTGEPAGDHGDEAREHQSRRRPEEDR